MARPKKNTVEYFPHSCNHGKTLFVLEQKYGNDGYVFWFRLLEELGNHDGHFWDLSDQSELEFLAAKTRFTTAETMQVLNLLCRIGAIDAELWQQRIVWSQKFVDGVADAYRRRKSPVPTKPVSDGRNDDTQKFMTEETTQNGRNDGRNPQTKLNETKQEETISSSSEEEASPRADEDKQFSISENPEGRPEEHKPAQAPAPAKKPDPQIDAALAAIRDITSLPPGGKKTRIYTASLLRQLAKAYPAHDPGELFRTIVSTAHNLGDSWHAPKAHKPDHLYYSWGEIMQTAKARAGPKKDQRVEAARRRMGFINQS